MKKVDLGEPPSFLDNVYLYVLNVNVRPTRTILKTTET